MGKPWEINGDDIAQWASRYDAPAVLPKLVRRLLAATTPLDGLEMRADAGVHFGGWDGVVRARDGNRFCPPGISVWELSVEEKAKGKLDKDFEKRTKAPPEPIRPRLTTYVAVVARRLAWKERWEKEKKAAGGWLDVRVLDADDLATWLEAAPAVGRWFAGVLGRPSADLTDVEAFLEGWSRRTSPPLPWELVLAGADRQHIAKYFVTLLVDAPRETLSLRGETREEALLFAAAAMAKSPDAERWLGRVLVAESEEGWRWALEAPSAQPLIVLTAFAGAEHGAATVRAVLAVEELAFFGERVGPGVGLRSIPYEALARGLVESGRPEREAERLAIRSGGSLQAMQRLSGYVELPAWAKGAPRRELTALLLAGAWVPDNEADRRVVAALGGDPADVERMCKALEQRPGKPLVSWQETGGQIVWTWREPRDAWSALVGGLTEANLRRFASEVLRVLNGLDPVEAPLPGLQATSGTAYHRPSSALRERLATSVAWLAMSDDQLRSIEGTAEGSKTADRIVRRLLDPLPGSRPWAALSPFVPTLAEAAPEAFLDVLEASLSQGDQGVAHLLADGSATAPTGFLRALETLGWSPDVSMVQRVALALARLAAPAAGELRDAPRQSLAKLLHPVMPQSQIAPRERLEILRDLFQRYPGVGWEMAVESASKMQYPWGEVHRPTYLPWKGRPPSESESQEQVEGAVGLLLAHVGHDAALWAKLVEESGTLPERVWSALDAARPHLSDPEGRVWAALRLRLARLHLYFKRSDDGAPTEWANVESLYGSFEPSDISVRYAWLFQMFPPLPSAFDAQKLLQQSNELRAAAVVELWKRDDRWERLAELVRSVPYPGILGAFLGSAPFSIELELRLLDGPADPTYAPVVPAFGAARFTARGDVVWLADVLRRLIGLGRLPDAAGVCCAAFDREEVWDLLDDMGDPLRREYWRAGPIFTASHSDAQWERAVVNSLDAGRADAALRAVRQSKGAVSSAVGLRVVEGMRDLLVGPPREGVDRTYLREPTGDLIESLSQDPSVDAERLVSAYVAVLPHQVYSSRFASAPISRAFAARPQLFVDLFLQEGGDRGSLLFNWNGYPGEGLPEGERDAALEGFARYVLDRMFKERKGSTALRAVAEILVRAPDGADGLWPCLAARRLLERNAYEGLPEQLIQAARRHREGHWSNEGESEARMLANKHRGAAERFWTDYPRTAAMLDALARAFEAEADTASVEAERHAEDQKLFGEHLRDQLWPPALAPAVEPAGPLTRIEIHDVGPARDMAIDLAPRLNLFLGDNSAGKTFALDVLWWALTGTWSTLPARPRTHTNNGKGAPSFVFAAGDRRGTSTYEARHERWAKPFAPPPARGLAVYARVDGGFSIWDPIRNAKPAEAGEIDLLEGYHFSREDLWQGRHTPDGMTSICHGLLEDAVLWRSEQRDAFALLEKALAGLSPPGESIQLGLPQRFAQRDDRKLPTILMSYGPVFAVHASAAVKRILGLAYALVWGWTNYREAATLAGVAPLPHVVMLVDEVEAHLHPKWQRTILPALLGVAKALEIEVQLVVTTHAPTVLASLEGAFDDGKDALFQFSLPEPPAEGRDAEVTRVPWPRHGDVNAWLSASDAFHTPTRGPAVQAVLDEASRLFEEAEPDPKQGRAIDRKLRKVLGELDPFWIRWRFIAEKRGWIRDPSRKKARPAGV